MTLCAPLQATLFRPDGVITLAEVRALSDLHLDGNLRRDTLSAFNVLQARAGTDLAATPASAPRVRKVFSALSPVALSLSDKRYANLRSLIVRAVERYGMKRTRLTSRVPLSSEWTVLLETVENRTYRQGVKRLAHYCSALGISPEEVRSGHLVGLHDALEAECMTKHPRKIIKHTIAMWNQFGRTVPGWPVTVLASPFTSEPDTMPLDRFPASFRADVARWTERMTKPNPLDPEAPVRPLKPSTVVDYVVFFRRFASALVRRDILPIDEISSLAVFFEGDNFKQGLRHFLPPDAVAGDARTAMAFRIAGKLRHVARHWVHVDAARQQDIDLICRRLDPQLPRMMGRRNRDRLEQFDDPEAVRKLLIFPEEEAARALRKPNPFRRAKGIERALAVSLLIFTGLRIKNLRHIRHASDIRRGHGQVVLKVEAAEVKNGQALEFDLPTETLALLDLFLAHRPPLPGSNGPYLFPGETGGPKSDNAMRDAVSRPLKKHCGLIATPHLGTETAAASRTLNRMLQEARDSPELAEG